MPALRDLTGSRFGEWEVLERSENRGRYVMWKCLCHGCGTVRDVDGKSLIKGISTSCGCKKKNKENVVGKIFGKLRVVSQDDNICECVCSCGSGKIIKVTVSKLIAGKVKSCGCLLHTDEDLTGQRFGKLVAIKKVTGGYLCDCDCGTKNRFFKSYLLRNNIAKSCGCKVHDFSGEDLTGRVFGVFNVLRLGEKTKNGYKWLCRCTKCGLEKEILHSNLLKGLSEHCNCEKVGTNKDFTGLTIGNWKFLENVDTLHWRCRCENCGKEKIVNYSNVIRGLSNSCGCLDIAHRGSKVENELKYFIKTIRNDININKDKYILDGKEIDIYLPEYHLGIEYNGSHCHASKNNLYIDKSKTYHRDKFLIAKEKGIHLINIFDVDYEENKDKINDFLRDMISPINRIYARQCEIRKVEKCEANKFYDTYHLQNHNNFTQINYGLYYNDDLVACMGFGKLRMKNAKKENHYELHRYCVKSGYSIIGGSQKLFKHFIEDYKPKYILSYSDNDYFSGNMYNKLGFSYIGQTTISYYWYLNGKKIKREKCQPKLLKQQYPELYDENVRSVENDIMVKLGARKVYRSGNTIWEIRW